MRYMFAIIGVLAIASLNGCKAPQPTHPTTEEPLVTPEEDPMVSVGTLVPAPEGFIEQHVGSDEWPIPPHAEHLRGVRVCLDPGHGGDAHKRGYKRGPTGVREAEMNLRVAQYLRAFLEAAGAEVLLTREGDDAVSLKERARIANEWDADLFISLHHNAIGNKPQVNRTSVWYHKDVDYRPANLDLARYLCYGLFDSLRLDQITGVPLKSDQLMYESGFGILRQSEVTTALCESSFFTNPEEEQRLRQPEYNLLEAYGLFCGLVEYAASGLPRAQLHEPADGVVGMGAGQVVIFKLDDGLRTRKSWGSERQMILGDSIAVRVDGEGVPFTFVNDGYLLTVDLPTNLTAGKHAVEVQFQNMFKNSIIKPHFEIEVR